MPRTIWQSVVWERLRWRGDNSHPNSREIPVAVRWKWIKLQDHGRQNSKTAEIQMWNNEYDECGIKFFTKPIKLII